ncbi:uncharacterized protein LOC131155311 [Malania oleifera]|uniref:uncharacterized protein LOC131155311 n=1 Tax=Malania oleifera TaxID=397392 RepID=UPI0025ADC721|nr:uncharacterized protein LOC131155311 [Malania oleifera]
MATTTGFTKTKILLLRNCRGVGSSRSVRELAGVARPPHHHHRENYSAAGTIMKSSDNKENSISSSNSGSSVGAYGCWVPHPRTGIYFPRGQERVMEDVPDGAASLRETYWFRNIDGVDKPDLPATVSLTSSSSS